MYIKRIYILRKYQRPNALLPDGLFHDEDWACVWAANHWATIILAPSLLDVVI